MQATYTKEIKDHMLKCKEALAVGCPQCQAKVDLEHFEAHYEECVALNNRLECKRNFGATFKNGKAKGEGPSINDIHELFFPHCTLNCIQTRCSIVS